MDWLGPAVRCDRFGVIRPGMNPLAHEDAPEPFWCDPLALGANQVLVSHTPTGPRAVQRRLPEDDALVVLPSAAVRTARSLGPAWGTKHDGARP